MRAVMLVVLLLSLTSGTSRAEWKMFIHRGAEVDMHDVAGVDSVTFADVSIGGLVPPGVFTMGDGLATCGVDQRVVTLTRAINLGSHEVTNQEYLNALQWAYERGYVTASAAAVKDNLDGSDMKLLEVTSQFCEIQFSAGSGFYLRESPSPEAQGSYPGGYDPADHPVKMVTWYGAARYCDWLSMQELLPRAYQHAGDWSCNGGDPYAAAGYRLPTDAEWEYAAQWNDDRVYPWGDEAPACHLLNHDYCVGWTAPIGSCPPAPAVLGLSDMAGNVWEWCNDWHECALGGGSAVNPTGPVTGSQRVIRGGSWSSSASPVRCAHRGSYEPLGSPFGLIGLRTVRSVQH